MIVQHCELMPLTWALHKWLQWHILCCIFYHNFFKNLKKIQLENKSGQVTLWQEFCFSYLLGTGSKTKGALHWVDALS